LDLWQKALRPEIRQSFPQGFSFTLFLHPVPFPLGGGGLKLKDEKEEPSGGKFDVDCGEIHPQNQDSQQLPIRRHFGFDGIDVALFPMWRIDPP
jgi:hypothetical protein